MRVQFEGRNNTRSGAINIATLPCSYAHCASERFSPRWFLVCDTVSGAFRRSRDISVNMLEGWARGREEKKREMLDVLIN